MLGELTLCLTLTRCKPIYLITSAQSRSFVAFALHRRVELPSCLVGLKLAAGGNQMRWVPARAILYGLRPHLRWTHLLWLLNTAQANAGRSRRHVPHARAARGEPHLLTLTPTTPDPSPSPSPNQASLTDIRKGCVGPAGSKQTSDCRWCSDVTTAHACRTSAFIDPWHTESAKGAIHLRRCLWTSGGVCACRNHARYAGQSRLIGRLAEAGRSLGQLGGMPWH